MAGRLRPTGRDRRHTARRQDLALSGRQVAEGETARDHLHHELMHRVEETERSFWRDSRGHADDQAGVNKAGRRAFSWNFSITHCDAVCSWPGIRPVANGPGQP